jgi:hypothetical protein
VSDGSAPADADSPPEPGRGGSFEPGGYRSSSTRCASVTRSLDLARTLPPGKRRWVDEEDPGAFLREQACGGLSDSTRTASHERDLVLESRHRVSSQWADGAALRTGAAGLASLAVLRVLAVVEPLA